MAYKIDSVDTWEPVVDGWVTSKELNESYKKSQKNFVKWSMGIFEWRDC